MPKKRTNELIQSTYFRWILRERAGVYFADGRANQTRVGRHSLGTRDRSEALELLRELDLTKAVEHGLADASLLKTSESSLLGLDRGRQLYEDHVRRPHVTGGARPKTSQRYKAVFDKFLPFARGRGITGWNQVTRLLLENYAAHLDDEGYAPRTEYLELTTIKQTMKWLADDKHIPTACLFAMSLKKPQGTDTYCWKPDEVTAIIRHCRHNAELNWLGNVFTALIATGMRISELASLRWTDIVDDGKAIQITDEASRRNKDGENVRRTKSGRSRILPVHPELKLVLDQMPRSKDGLVFHGPLGGKLKPDTVRVILVRDVLTPLAGQFPTPEGEVGFLDGRLHSCRHYFCSRCADEGTSEQALMEWLGHRESKMIRHYYHIHEKTAQRQMSRLRLVGEAGGEDTAGNFNLVEPEIPKTMASRRKT